MQIVGKHRDWIAGAVQHPGGLHKALQVPPGQPIPPQKEMKATHSTDDHLRHMAMLAETFKRMGR